MNLARALSMVPREIRTTPGLHAIPEPKTERPPIQQKHVSRKPEGLVEATAIIWYTGQVSTEPVSWARIQRWVQATYNISYYPESLRHAITRYGIPRKNKPRHMRDDILLACMQSAIVQRAHGNSKPWLKVRDQLWIKHRINLSNRTISNAVMSWAGLRGAKR